MAYTSHAQFQKGFDRLVDNVERNAEFVISRGRESVLSHIFEVFRLAAVCTKHPGFHEEREWRVVYNPVWEQSSRIIQAVETIRGVPQIVQKIPLKDVPEKGLIGISIQDLVERVIIGPTDFPREIREATIELLKSKGVQGAPEKVIISDIPLRHPS